MSETFRKTHAAAAGRRLRKARLALGYPVLRRFAQMVDIDEDTLGAYERGQNLIPPHVVSKLKQVFGLTQDYIYDGETRGLDHGLALKILAMPDEDEPD